MKFLVRKGAGILVAIWIPLIIIFALFSTTNLYAQPQVFSVDSKPHGLSYGEWSMEWWKWLHSIPKERSPAADQTGAFCAENQNVSGPVWYLAGTWGGKETRSCTIPYGKSILISPIEMLCSKAEHNIETEDEMRKCAKQDQDRVLGVEVTVDGVHIPDLSNYRVQSPLFNLSLPEDNSLGKPAQVTPAVSDGYFIMLKPLSRGEHTIQSKGSLPGTGTSEAQNFVSHAIYNITVK